MHHNLLVPYLMSPPWWLAIAVSLAIAATAWRYHWLTGAGSLSAFVMGSVIYDLGGGRAVVPLLGFLLSGTLLSKLNNKDQADSSRPRTASQVWANGGIATIIVLLFTYLKHRWPLYQLENVQLVYLCTISAVNADTWSTEIGKLFGKNPLSLRSGRVVTKGTSGAISLVGTAGGFCGALFIPLTVYFLWPLNSVELILTTWVGFLACLTDSILGASIQAQYQVSNSQWLSDTPQEAHQKPAQGIVFVTNDVVNFLTAASGVIYAVILMHFAYILFGA